MGYEITQFVDEVDVEFHCAICMMVLQHPMESPCEHAFCNECITKWLSINSTCPVDRLPLTLRELKVPSRIVRNFLNKREIKCNFKSDGCTAIIRLEDLEEHVSTCEYNLDAEVVCDKGCNIKMRRREYQENDCVRHLADEADRLQDVSSPPEWQVCHNIFVSRTAIFIGDGSCFSFVQYFRSTSPRNSSIKVQILEGLIDIGFSPQGHPINLLPGRNASSIGYDAHHGQLWVDGTINFNGPLCRNGDIVEVGIKFPTDFINNGNFNVELFVSINDHLLTKIVMKMPNYAIFPTISMWGSNAGVDFLGN